MIATPWRLETRLSTHVFLKLASTFSRDANNLKDVDVLKDNFVCSVLKGLLLMRFNSFPRGASAGAGRGGVGVWFSNWVGSGDEIYFYSCSDYFIINSPTYYSFQGRIPYLD